MLLVTVDDIATDRVPAQWQRHTPVLRTLARWTHEYLAAPHPDLGRPGNVCPFMPAALSRGSVYLRVEEGADPDLTAVSARLLVLRDWFLELSQADPAHKMHYAILTAFPEIPPERMERVIEGTQAELKDEFVATGTMIGEFHPLPPSRHGLWNEHFRPFGCPVPVLAIRHMVSADLPFLDGEPEHVEAYLERYANNVPAHLEAHVGEVIEEFDIDVEAIEGAET